MPTPKATHDVEKERAARHMDAGGHVRVRVMTDVDLSRILDLRTVVRWSADPRSFDLLRGIRDARWAVAETPAGDLIGMVGAVPLGRIGLLCQLAVHDDYRGFGIGSRLSAWAVAYLKSRGAKTIRLYATRRAEGLYRSLGFRAVAYRTKYRLKIGERGRETTSEDAGYEVGPLVMADLPEVYGLDRWTYGGDRSALIFATLRLHPGRGLVIRDSSGRVKGYLMRGDAGHATRIGPFVAETSTAARLLLDNTLLDLKDTTVEVTVPDIGSEPACTLFQERGFAGCEDRLCMKLGKATNVHPPGLVQYGTTSYLAT